MEIAAFVFAGGILLVGIILVAIFRENRARAAQMAAYNSALAVRRARDAAELRPRTAKRERPAA